MAPDAPLGPADFKLYPNPVRDRLQVVLGEDSAGVYSIAVFNAAGVQILKKSGIYSGTKTAEVNTSILKSGLYTLVLTDASSAARVEKFVKE